MIDELVSQKLGELSSVFSAGVSKEKFRRDLDGGGHCYCLLGGVALVSGGPIGPDLQTYLADEVLDHLKTDPLAIGMTEVLAEAAGVRPGTHGFISSLTYWSDANATSETLTSLIEKAKAGQHVPEYA